MKQLFTVVYTFVIAAGCYGQYGETIRSGRPGQAIGPYTTGHHVFQVQAGADQSGFSSEPDVDINTASTDIGSVFRYGLTEHFEFAAVVGFSQLSTTIGNQNSKDDGLSNVTLRVRSNVVESKNSWPAVGYQLNVKLPVGDPAFRPTDAAPAFILITGQPIGEKFSLTTNWGLRWTGTSTNPNGFYVLNLGYSITDKLGVFAEQYATITPSGYEGKIDGGVAFLVNKDLQLDMFGGFDRLRAGGRDYFVSLGVSWRMPGGNRDMSVTD